MRELKSKIRLFAGARLLVLVILALLLAASSAATALMKGSSSRTPKAVAESSRPKQFNSERAKPDPAKPWSDDAAVATASPSCTPTWYPGPDLWTVAARSAGVYFPPNGRFYSIGGRYADVGVAMSGVLNPIEYDMGANAWVIKTAALPDGLVNNMACGVLTVDGTPAIYCVGGNAAGPPTSGSRVFSYNPVTDTITSLAAADNWPGNTTGAIVPGGFAVADNKLYVVGGLDLNVGNSTSETWVFDPTAAVGSRWQQRLNYPVARSYIPTVSIGGLIYTAGGTNFSSSSGTDTVDSFKYDPLANTWSTIATIPRATGETRAVTVNNQMWVLGGGRTSPNPSGEVDVYDPLADGWSMAQPFATPRRNFAAASNGTNVWLVGGYNTNGTLLSSMEILYQCPLPTPSPTPSCLSLNEGFNDISSLVPDGWSLQEHSEPQQPIAAWLQGSGFFTAQSGQVTSFLFGITTGNGGTINRWALTPPLVLQDGAALTFWTRTDDPNFNPLNKADRLQIRMSTNGASTNAGTSFNDVGDFTSLLLDINPTYNSTGYPTQWTQFTVVVTGVATPTTGRLAFRYYIDDVLQHGDRIGIDTINFNGCTAGPAPSPTPSATPTPTPTPTPGPSPTCGALTEDFEDISTLEPAGWSMQNHSGPLGTTNWFQGNLFPSQSGGSYIAANYQNAAGAGTISDWLLTPPWYLQNGATMTFYTRTQDPAQYADRLQVRMSTNGASTDVGTTETDVGDFTTLLLDINSSLDPTGYPSEWTQFTVTISGLPSPTIGRLAFRYFVENAGPEGVNSDYIGIDTVQFNSVCAPTAADSSISGEISTANGQPLAGVVLSLSGSSTRRAITDAAGRYSFTDLESGSFYNVTPSLVNYNFSPSSRSFSLIANQTNAVFTAVPGATIANPMDTPEYFVRQQYLDFLAREPDPGGFAYWSDQINQCGNDAACLGQRRIEVSAAFFVTQEFQQTGSFIYDLYAVGLRRQPVFTEYSSDRQQVIGGLQLDAARTAFAESFVQRQEFITAYHAGTTAESFVNLVLLSAESLGVDLSSKQAKLISIYQNGAGVVASRAAVLATIAEQPSFKQAQYNSAFVLVEYFGYLRRDPDPEGYEFWLQVLNGDSGNHRGMVCSFITSAEYQQRFSSIVSRNNAECAQ